MISDKYYNDAYLNTLVKTKELTATSGDYGHISFSLGFSNFHIVSLETNTLIYAIEGFYKEGSYVLGRVLDIANTNPKIAIGVTLTVLLRYILY